MKSRTFVVFLGLALFLVAAVAGAESYYDVVKSGSAREVKAELDHGQSSNAIVPHSQGRTVLMWAAQYNKDPAVITVLLKAGASLSAISAEEKWTALMWAANSNANPEVITTLLKAGANANDKDPNGLSALMLAAEYNANPEVAARLVKAGAEVNAKDTQGFTALMLAASKNDNAAMISMLLKLGADAKLKNAKGYSALEYGKYNRALADTDALRQLEKASQ